MYLAKPQISYSDTCRRMELPQVQTWYGALLGTFFCLLDEGFPRFFGICCDSIYLASLPLQPSVPQLLACRLRLLYGRQSFAALPSTTPSAALAVVHRQYDAALTTTQKERNTQCLPPLESATRWLGAAAKERQPRPHMGQQRTSRKLGGSRGRRSHTERAIRNGTG